MRLYDDICFMCFILRRVSCIRCLSLFPPSFTYPTFALYVFPPLEPFLYFFFSSPLLPPHLATFAPFMFLHYSSHPKFNDWLVWNVHLYITFSLLSRAPHSSLSTLYSLTFGMVPR
mmetsp:Transcript_34986/g.90633  ORF Transcript_34986/g.90633 Transcript_34986/m.90633 type:complete len:116 (-) Transcript_34986:188-535(-)